MAMISFRRLPGARSARHPKALDRAGYSTAADRDGAGDRLRGDPGTVAGSSRPPPDTVAEQRLHIRAPVPRPAGLIADLGQPPAPRPGRHRRRGHPEQGRHLPAGHQILIHAAAVHCRGCESRPGRTRHERARPDQRRPSCSSRFPSRTKELAGQRQSSSATASRQRPDAIPDRGAACTKNGAANCSQKHQSADRYRTIARAAFSEPPTARQPSRRGSSPPSCPAWPRGRLRSAPVRA